MRPLAWLAAALLVTAACASARRGEPLLGPLALDETARLGRDVFLQRCHACHPGGEGGLGPALNNKPLPDFLKRFQVRHGAGAMPGFDETAVDDREMDALMEYLKRLRHHDAGR